MAETFAGKFLEYLRNDKEADYYLGLGSFVAEFSAIEEELQLTLRHFSRLKPLASKAIFSGTRVEAGVSLIKRLLEVKPLRSPKKQAKLLDVLDQLKAINDARNLILHYGGKWQDGHTWLVTTESVAHTDRTKREMRLTLDQMAAMCADLIKIKFHLIEARKGASKLARIFIGDALKAAWLYRRPGQGKKGQGQKAVRKGRRKLKPRQRPPSHQ